MAWSGRDMGVCELPNMKNDALAMQFRSWATGVEFELQFWENWMKTSGAQWPDDFAIRVAGDGPVDLRVVEGLADPLTARFLDVGAGPITAHGVMWQGRKIDLVCVDPLAPYYAELGTRYGVSVNVKQAFAEDLTAAFEEGTFDRTMCRNALDHSFDPMRGIEEMIRVTKIGGKIFLDHWINEAEFNKYADFHQWNFDEDNGRFVIWDGEGEAVRR